MDFSELTIRSNDKGVAHEYWNGTAPLESHLKREALPGILAMLPSRKSSDEELWSTLSMIASRFIRRLVQDELGPTRADQMEMLRRQLETFDELRSLLSDFSEAQFVQLLRDLHELLVKSRRIDSDTLINAIRDAAEVDQEQLVTICAYLADAADTNTALRAGAHETGNAKPFDLPSLNEFDSAILLAWIDAKHAAGLWTSGTDLQCEAW
jgi:hypothetical protein